jgi:hypothetical protein
MNLEYYVLLSLRYFVGLIFLLSSISKLSNIPEFQQSITNFKILPRRMSYPLALAFLFGEIIAFILLMFGQNIFFIWGVIQAFILLTLFSLALSSVLFRGIATTCNCFGETKENVSLFHLLRNIGLLFILIMMIITFMRNGFQAVSMLDFLLLAPMAFIFALIYLNLNEFFRILLNLRGG